MTSRHNRQQYRTFETPLNARGERAIKLARGAGKAMLATAVLGVGALLVTSGSSNEEILPVSATQNIEKQMDDMIAKELQKGPEGDDVILNGGQPFTVGPSATIADAMIRIDSRAQIGAGPTDTIHTKATTASAENFEYENGTILSESKAIMWADRELEETFGRTVLLAVPASRPEL